MEGIKGIHFYLSKVGNSINSAIDDSFKTVWFFCELLVFPVERGIKTYVEKEEKKWSLQIKL